MTRSVEAAAGQDVVQRGVLQGGGPDQGGRPRGGHLRGAVRRGQGLQALGRTSLVGGRDDPGRLVGHRHVGEVSQAVAIGRAGERRSQLGVCLDAAEVYLLTRTETADIVDEQVTLINEQWDEAADSARLTRLERQQLWHRQILNPSVVVEN